MVKSLASIIGVAAVLIGCEKISTTFTTNPRPPDASTSSIAGIELPHPNQNKIIASEVAISPPSETHNYEVEKDGEYGYRQVISQEERSRGVVATPLVMVRYKGIHRGVYVAEFHQSAGGVSRMECKRPCHAVKLKLIMDGEVLDSTTVYPAEGSVLAAALDDAQHGRLRIYASTRNAPRRSQASSMAAASVTQVLTHF